MYRAVHWTRIRGSPAGKSKERTLEKVWRATEKLPQRLRVVDGGHVACGSTGRFATIFATMLGRFWRSCGGIDSGSCVTPAADCGVRRALSRRIKLFHFGDQPRDGSRDIDRFLLIRQCGPCAGATGCGVHYPGFTERPAERLCLCNVNSRVSQLKYLPLCMRNFLECLTSSGTFLVGTIASTNSRDQLSAQVQ